MAGIRPKLLSTLKDIAASTPYKAPKQSFGLYHSVQGHTKLVQKRPWQLYVTILLFLSLPVIFYYIYQNVFNKPSNNDISANEIFLLENLQEQQKQEKLEKQ